MLDWAPQSSDVHAHLLPTSHLMNMFYVLHFSMMSYVSRKTLAIVGQRDSDKVYYRVDFQEKDILF